MTLRLRITLLVAGAVALAVAAVSVATFYFAQKELRGELDEFLLSRASLVELTGRFPAGIFGLVEGPLRPGFDFPVGGIIGTDSVVQIISQSGELVFAFRDAPLLPVEPADLEIATQGGEPILRTVDVEGVSYRMITASAPRIGGLQIARDLTETNAILTDLGARLFLIGVIGVALSALAGWVVAGRALVPVGKLTSAAEHVADTQDLTSPIEVGRSDELGRLALSFNTMLEALARSRQQQQRLVMDASHELRTPITSLRTNLEVLARNEDMAPAEQEQLLVAVRSELDELTLLVAELVDLSTDATATEEPTTRLRLDDLVEATVELAKRRTGREIDLETEEVTVEGRAAMLDRAVSNLLDNAHKWSPDGARVEVVVKEGRVTVRDQGPGIPAEDLPYVFDRFYRSPEARSMPGSGLGLSIVKQVVEAHRGEVWVEAADGGGTVAGFELPNVE